MNGASTATAAEGGCDAGGICDTFSSTLKRDSSDLSKEHPSPFSRTKGARALQSKAFPVSFNSTMPNLMPGLEAVLRRLLREGPTVASVLKTSIRASTPPWLMRIGDVDSCVKLGRPDAVQDTLGLTVLDEPVALPMDSEGPSLRLSTCIPATGDNEPANNPSLTSRVDNTRTMRQEVEAWVATVRAHHRELAASAKAARLESAFSDLHSDVQRPFGLHVKTALQQQFLFCVSELPMLSLSVEHMAKIICWLSGVPSIQSVKSPLPELLALFSLCLEELPASSNTAIEKEPQVVSSL